MVEVRFGPGHDCGRLTGKPEVISVARIVSGWPTTRPLDSITNTAFELSRPRGGRCAWVTSELDSETG